MDALRWIDPCSPVLRWLAPSSWLPVPVPLFTRFRSRRHSGPMSRQANWIRTSHHTPFRPYGLDVARTIAIEHADCPSSRCGAGASAMSMLIAAGLTSEARRPLRTST